MPTDILTNRKQNDLLNKSGSGQGDIEMIPEENILMLDISVDQLVTLTLGGLQGAWCFINILGVTLVSVCTV